MQYIINEKIKMGRIATNTIEQIEKLQKRGMDLDYDIPKVKEILLDIGYYRLGFYWNPFEKNGEHEFVVGTKFSDAVTLYYLDVDLRHLLIRYINRIEINFRTKVVYYVSNKHKASSTWFADPSIISADFIESLDNHYTEDFVNNNKTIKLHHKNYINDKYAPAWKTLEFFTFGRILKVFKSLKDNNIKERIAKEYGVLNLRKFINFLDTIVYVRNTCAHGGVLFDLNTPKGIAIIADISFNHENRNSLDSAIKIIMFLLNQISPDRKDDMNKCLNELFEKHKENDILKKIIEKKIGFVY